MPVFYIHYLFLTAHLNSCINPSIILLFCSTFFNSATFADSNLVSSASISSNRFSFHTFSNSSCTYINIHCTCSSTYFSLNLILIYISQVITNPATCLASPLNKDGYTISLISIDLILGVTVTPAANIADFFLIAVIYSTYYTTRSYNCFVCSTSACQLII